MRLVIATGNPHKVDEFSRILSPLGIEAVPLAQVGGDCDIEETGQTFAENARIKAQHVFRQTGLPCVADDSGLCVDALEGRPGVQSARYCGEDAGYDVKIPALLAEVEGLAPEQRTCRFVSAICCVLADGSLVECQEACEGYLGEAPAGEGGFGYDPIFYIGGKSFAQLSGGEKDRLSHRGKALRRFAALLGESLKTNNNK